MGLPFHIPSLARTRILVQPVRSLVIGAFHRLGIFKYLRDSWCSDVAEPRLALWEERERRRLEIIAIVEEADASLARGEGSRNR